MSNAAVVAACTGIFTRKARSPGFSVAVDSATAEPPLISIDALAPAANSSAGPCSSPATQTVLTGADGDRRNGEA
jgi:hypothetical protein